MKGIAIKPTIGIGDALQFSSVPENYFRATGQKLYDVNRPWFFDHNPFIVRDDGVQLEETKEMWNFGPSQYTWPKLREEGVYLSNAEIHASVWGVPVSLNRPRLYRFEDHPFERRTAILLHIEGVSHGKMPDQILKHVISKYKNTMQLFHIGLKAIPELQDLGVFHLRTDSLWELAKIISMSRMLICMDSGPAWIAACYPDVVVKKIRTKPTPEYFKTWVPLDVRNIHSHWDDRCHQIFNPTEDDIGFTSSYRRI